MISNELIGTGWSFPPKFQKPGLGPQMNSGKSLIEQSLSLLLNTQLQERPLVSGFGCNLTRFMFDTPGPSELADMKEEIDKAVTHNESRIKLKEIYFDTQYLYEGLLQISLEYVIKSNNATGNLVFPFYLSQGSLSKGGA